MSYLRARYINEFWKQNGINLEKIPRCELIISGSGEGGVPRIIPDEGLLHQQYPHYITYPMHPTFQERLIHPVPKRDI